MTPCPTCSALCKVRRGAVSINGEYKRIYTPIHPKALSVGDIEDRLYKKLYCPSRGIQGGGCDMTYAGVVREHCHDIAVDIHQAVYGETK